MRRTCPLNFNPRMRGSRATGCRGVLFFATPELRLFSYDDSVPSPVSVPPSTRSLACDGHAHGRIFNVLISGLLYIGSSGLFFLCNTPAVIIKRRGTEITAKLAEHTFSSLDEPFLGRAGLFAIAALRAICSNFSGPATKTRLPPIIRRPAYGNGSLRTSRLTLISPI
ncbi:hypothetical protein EV127DRAFT_434897, partial [Xylaria flabelliformis]